MAAVGVTLEMAAAMAKVADDAKVIARAREVANLATEFPSDVGDVLTRWLRDEMPLAEVMESFDGLALDYQRKVA